MTISGVRFSGVTENQGVWSRHLNGLAVTRNATVDPVGRHCPASANLSCSPPVNDRWKSYNCLYFKHIG